MGRGRKQVVVHETIDLPAAPGEFADVCDELPETSDAAARMPDPESPAQASGFHVVLVEPEIAANTGAIGRTCVATAATLWLVRPLGFHIDDRNLRRAGLDYWQHLDLRVVESLDEVAVRLGGDRLWFFSTKATQIYTQARFHRGDALVFGPESRGLPERLLILRPDRALRIPIFPEARSLNLANAVAIGLYEAMRQLGRW
jgi:tRNA (cytidine/uridine-2'-O-)-methyltransferase